MPCHTWRVCVSDDKYTYSNKLNVKQKRAKDTIPGNNVKEKKVKADISYNTVKENTSDNNVKGTISCNNVKKKKVKVDISYNTVKEKISGNNAKGNNVHVCDVCQQLHEIASNRPLPTECDKCWVKTFVRNILLN